MWQDDMKREAVKIADSEFELQDGDVIELEVTYDEGWDQTFGEAHPRAEATVRVLRDGKQVLWQEWSGEDDFNRFWLDLMSA